MYDNFFGFKERPFQLVPNPAYLFLSRSHEEAIAHLRYAISHGDGFVEISGEVGTGKTTLCRAFLDGLDDNTEVAYIFNPQLNALELLKAINDEFGISSEAGTTKELIDILNSFLIEKKKEGKNAILLVDEAQNLDKTVLEQLRLLSNLETNTSKLLQIILVGQPELQKLLDSYDLRQLRQRITLSWYLTPLTRKETKEYIRHRINIASQKTEDKFSDSAYDIIYKYSGGIPRLINIACDRALLTAFGFNKRKVTGAIAVDSIRELTARGNRVPGFFSGLRLIAVSVVLVCIIAVAAFFILKKSPPLSPTPSTAKEKKEPLRQTPPHPLGQEKTRTADTGSIQEIQEVQKEKFNRFLAAISGRPSRSAAVKTVFELWKTPYQLDTNLENMDDDPAYFNLTAARHHFQVLRDKNDWDMVKKLNLPVILEFLPPGATSPRYLVLTKLSGNYLFLRGGERAKTIRILSPGILANWTGNFYIFWKDFYNYQGNIPQDAPKESVFTLKLLLRDIGYDSITLDQIYDDKTMETVKRIQEKHGIGIDGIVGSKTKIVIYNEKKDLGIPHITGPGNKTENPSASLPHKNTAAPGSTGN